jgi:hypothetical protein
MLSAKSAGFALARWNSQHFPYILAVKEEVNLALIVIILL